MARMIKTATKAMAPKAPISVPKTATAPTAPATPKAPMATAKVATQAPKPPAAPPMPNLTAKAKAPVPNRMQENPKAPTGMPAAKAMGKPMTSQATQIQKPATPKPAMAMKKPAPQAPARAMEAAKANKAQVAEMRMRTKRRMP